MNEKDTPWSRLRGGRIPLWLKVAYTLFLAVLLPYYWINYGPQNFLWFCDVALILTLPALWLESRFLTSMQVVGILIPQLAWNVDFFWKLFTGWEYAEASKAIAGYMFNPEIPLVVRGLSSFHGWLPFVLVYMLWRLGYDRRAWLAQTLLVWVILPASYFLTAPTEFPDNKNWSFNVNYVHGGFGYEAHTWEAPALFLLAEMVIFPLGIYLPTHFLLLLFLPRSKIHGPPAIETPPLPQAEKEAMR